VYKANPRYALLVATLWGLAACTTGNRARSGDQLYADEIRSATRGRTANFSGVAAGVNVVETFRGPNGYTAIPISSATLTDPQV